MRTRMNRWLLACLLLMMTFGMVPLSDRLSRGGDPVRVASSNPIDSSVDVEPPDITSAAIKQQATPRNMNTRRPTGPLPMTVANVDRLHRFAEEAAADIGGNAEPWMRINSEPVDHAWADPLARQLADRLRVVGHAQTALQLADPRCFSSVCVVMANGGWSSEEANANWQRLLYTVAEERWFQENFKDISTSMRAEEKGTMYVTYLLRRGHDWKAYFPMNSNAGPTQTSRGR